MSQSRGARVSIGSIERKLRYRALLEDLVTLDVVEENLETINRTKKVVDETKLLLSDGNVDERVKNPGERHLDSRVLLATSDMVVRCSEAVSGNINTYNRDELAQQIHANPEFWRKFILPKAVPVYSYLYGTFQPTPSEERPKKPRKKIERSQLAALKKPESVDRLEKIEEGPEKVAQVYKFINKYYKSNGQKPINYFHCVLDPNHFGKTVENIYHISFLVRDGFISIAMDEESELPFITPVPKDQRERDKSQNKENSQFIVSINIKMWKDAVDAFGIKKPLMQISTKPSTHR